MHARIAAAIKAARGDRSAQWLADRTSELGCPITRAQIANYESGRKKGLDIAELIVLAAALETSPVNLVYPGPYQDSVEVLPGRESSEFIASQWFSGLLWHQDVVSESGDWGRATEQLNTWRAYQELKFDRLKELFGQRASEHKGGVRDRGRDREVIEEYDKRIAHLERQLGIEDGDA
ncbi:putative DNA-binding protein [Mycobacteroides stephanolepidis]|uniref:Putative DNA-binding protein n=2 Tax=[Mycobacterium] stephanolepidis TaxID=1520670 RepID=A0A1Z4ETQ7_9MYCO|nr:putative DNA-binding protein [[Mycobacterium] stephanolepidis]